MIQIQNTPSSHYLETPCCRNYQPAEITLLPAWRGEAEKRNSRETQTGNTEVWQPTHVFADQVHLECQRLCYSSIYIHKWGQTVKIHCNMVGM